MSSWVSLVKSSGLHQPTAGEGCPGYRVRQTPSLRARARDPGGLRAGPLPRLESLPCLLPLAEAIGLLSANHPELHLWMLVDDLVELLSLKLVASHVRNTGFEGEPDTASPRLNRCRTLQVALALPQENRPGALRTA